MSIRPRSAALTLATVAAVLTTVVIPARSVIAATPGTPGPLVYAMYGPSGDQQLFTAMPGGEPVPVPGTVGARSARWSPDGRVLAYDIWGVGIFLINPDGSGKRLLFEPPPGEIFSQPVWSPDGTALAWHVYRGAEPPLIAIADSASGIRESIPTQLEDVSDWLADGSFLGGAWRATDTGRQEEIAIESPDGTLTYLTDTPDMEEGVPRLSPDGTKIAYLAWNQTIAYSLGIMDRDGGNLRTFPEGTQVFWPAWSPTGAEIAIGPRPTGLRLDGTGRHGLLNGGGSGDGIDWATLPGTSPEEIQLAGIRTAALPDPAVRAASSVSTSTIWPTTDGYRDTVVITRRMYEPTRATLRVYSPQGTAVRTLTYRFDTGIATIKWNGRWSTGAIMPAGRYRVAVSWVDLAGNRRTTAQYVTLYRGYR